EAEEIPRRLDLWLQTKSARDRQQWQGLLRPRRARDRSRHGYNRRPHLHRVCAREVAARDRGRSHTRWHTVTEHGDAARQEGAQETDWVEPPSDNRWLAAYRHTRQPSLYWRARIQQDASVSTPRDGGYHEARSPGGRLAERALPAFAYRQAGIVGRRRGEAPWPH